MVVLQQTGDFQTRSEVNLLREQPGANQRRIGNSEASEMLTYSEQKQNHHPRDQNELSLKIGAIAQNQVR